MVSSASKRRVRFLILSLATNPGHLLIQLHIPISSVFRKGAAPRARRTIDADKSMFIVCWGIKRTASVKYLPKDARANAISFSDKKLTPISQKPTRILQVDLGQGTSAYGRDKSPYCQGRFECHARFEASGDLRSLTYSTFLSIRFLPFGWFKGPLGGQQVTD
jgi:hypothetical protein